MENHIPRANRLGEGRGQDHRGGIIGEGLPEKSFNGEVDSHSQESEQPSKQSGKSHVPVSGQPDLFLWPLTSSG